MGILLKDNMKAVLIGLALVAAVAANEIDVTDSASDRLFGLLCCNNVRSRCVLACAGQDCTRTCTGLCGVFASRCGPYTCSTLTTACNTPSPTPVPAPAPAPAPVPAPVSCTNSLRFSFKFRQME